MAHDASNKAIGKLLHGQSKSSREIAKACGCDVKTAQKWIKAWEKAGFKKGFLGSKLDQAEEGAAVKEREKLGLTKARVEAKVVQLMEAKKTVFWQGVRITDVEDNGTQVSAASLGADILGMKKVIVDPSDEFRTFWGGLKGARA